MCFALSKHENLFLYEINWPFIQDTESARDINDAFGPGTTNKRTAHGNSKNPQRGREP